MAPDDNAAQPAESLSSGREPLTPVKQKRLQQCFEHATEKMALGSHDYATELFAQCVVGDPSNLTYVQSYVGNLQKKYSNNKTGAKLAQFKERAARSAVKKAFSGEEWDEVIRQGLTVLKVNPWDVPALTAMATAADKMGDDEPELFYLKCALMANPKDPEVNRQTALALSVRLLYDQAIARWHRVQEARPDDPEAQRHIAELAVRKTMDLGGYEGDDSAKKYAGSSQPQARPRKTRREVPMKEQLEQRIAGNPKELSNYLELAQLHFNKEDYESGEKVLARALEASGDDPDVRERWEDAQLRRLRQQMTRAKDDTTRRKARKALIEKETDVYKRRCERYPNNLVFKYDLGVRYQLGKQYDEAIRQFQQAQNDPRRKGVCMLALGQCFQQIKQHRLAMSHYELAIKGIADRDEKNKKKALYLAGKMALALSDLKTSEDHLTRLAGLDFAYKDVSQLLERIAKAREKKDGE